MFRMVSGVIYWSQVIVFKLSGMNKRLCETWELEPDEWVDKRRSETELEHIASGGQETIWNIVGTHCVGWTRESGTQLEHTVSGGPETI
ncbi:hypothetical protein RRG08_036850 [Elysia crispata]|uniref:Uncharacterized protein n=1 Tax=Elysia crispata TaxID=231223 RepID=A0AAE1DBE5_9GAST|nr:hypothetical protein RRG08_036850 [Elysia crispata]